MQMEFGEEKGRYCLAWSGCSRSCSYTRTGIMTQSNSSRRVSVHGIELVKWLIDLGKKKRTGKSSF